MESVPPFKCRKCGLNKKQGRVDDEGFICTPCQTAERQAKLSGTVRYALVKVKGEYRIITAEYTETAKRFNRVRADGGWPYYNEHVLKKYSWSGMPGDESPEAAVAYVIKQRTAEIERRAQELEDLKKELEAVQFFASKMGPVPDPSCLEPTD